MELGHYHFGRGSFLFFYFVDRDTAPVIDDPTRKAVESLLDMAQSDRADAERAAAADAIVSFGNGAIPVLIEAMGREKSASAAQMLLPRMGVEAAKEKNVPDAPGDYVRH